jgi:signal transduction histidine kinase
VAASAKDHGESTEIFGNRIAIECGGRRFEIELGNQVLLLRDTTDRYLIEKEIGKLYRHELKAALDVMAAGLATVRQLITDEKGQAAVEFLDQVEDKRVELSSLLEERIDFIRLHSDAFQIRPSSVNLNLLVDKCVSTYREAAAAKEVTINSNHLHTEAVLVRGEERFLRKAIDNILRNALKFSPQGAEIKVVLGSERMEAFVRVEDSGPGIVPEHLGKIFQLGFTTDGTGRGLYMANRIVKAHDGRIEVTSKPGNGATFTVRLPLVTEV